MKLLILKPKVLFRQNDLKLLIKILLFLVFWSNYFSYAAEFEVSGYIFNLGSYSYSRENEILGQIKLPSAESTTNLLRARFRPVLYLGDNTRIESQYEINGMVSNRNMFVLTEISENRRQLYKLAQNLYTDKHTVVNHYLDRLFIKHSLDQAEITIGRQRISWGVGRVWQPTDLFNPLNPANFSKIEKDGADAVSAKYFFGDFTDLEIVYNPTMAKYSDNFGARFRTNYKQYDMSFMAGHFDNRTVLGGDFAGNLFDAGFRGEAIYSFLDGDYKKEFLKFILGLDYQFSELVYGLIEYQNNGEGSISKKDYDLFKLANGDILNVGVNYLALSLAYKLTDLTNLSISNNYNIDDNSGFSSVSMIYQYTQNLQLNLSLMATYGNSGSEYRFYPMSCFVIVDYFF